MLIANFMKIKFKSKELVKILKQQKTENEKIAVVHKDLVDADKRHKKLQFKVQRLKDKGVKVLDKVIKEQGVMDEFGYTGQMEIIDDEVFEVDMHNLFEDMFNDPEGIKERLRNDKKEKTGVYVDPLMLTGHNN